MQAPMKHLSSLLKSETESWSDYRLRMVYAIRRRIDPKLKEEHRLSLLVGPQGCWNELVQYQFNILTGVGVKPHHSLLDIGCGPLTAGLKLIPYLEPGNYVGVDLRAEPLAEARRLIAKHSLGQKNPTIIQSPSFGGEETSNRSFDFMWMSQLSYHLDDSLMVKLFEQARSRLAAGGTLVFDIMDPDRVLPPGSHWSGFQFHLRPLDYYRELGRRSGFSMTQRGRIEEFGYPKRISLKTNILLAFRRGPD
jgi:SAM-dependent methyltransferase